MFSDKSDQELVLAAQNGQKAAFDALVQRYQLKVTKLISRFINDSSETMDLTQEVFLRAYCALTQFRGDSAFYTWLYRVTINIIKNHLLHQGRQPPMVDLDIEDVERILGKTLLKDYTTPEGIASSDEVKNRIFDIVDNLNDDIRLAFILREMEGFSYEDIADILNCPLGTVRSRIFRAREAIDKEVALLMAE